MVARTRSNSLPRAGNPRAKASLAAGVLAVLAVPAGVALSWYSDRVTLLQSTGSAALAFVLGLYAVAQSRRAREILELTLGRAGGKTAARAGKALGVVAICIALTTAIALGFYGLLAMFAD